jgi:hypothetical protein
MPYAAAAADIIADAMLMLAHITMPFRHCRCCHFHAITPLLTRRHGIIDADIDAAATLTPLPLRHTFSLR